MDIIVDGYNLIGSERGLTGGLEHQRNWLLHRLSLIKNLEAILWSWFSMAGSQD